MFLNFLGKTAIYTRTEYKISFLGNRIKGMFIQERPRSAEGFLGRLAPKIPCDEVFSVKG
jgi:hypothetical protein